MKPDFATDEKEPTNLLSSKGKVKPAGLLTGKKPTLNKFGSNKANGLSRKKM